MTVTTSIVETTALMQGSLTQTIAPAIDPLSVADAKKHLNLATEHTEDDAYITDLITVAVGVAQTFTNRQFISATYVLRLDAFPTEIHPPKPPLASVTSITYTDAGGTSQTLAASKYQVDIYSMPARIRPAYGEWWPATRPDTYGAVILTYIAGYGSVASAVPLRIRQALKAIVATLYEHREPVITGLSVERIPETAERLLWPFRILIL